MRSQETAIYSRITELVSLLSDYDEEATVRIISRKTETSPAQTREDIIALNKFGLSVAPSDIVKKMSRDDSRFDDVVLSLDTDLPCGDPSAPYLLFLNRYERSIFKKERVNDLKVKDSPLSVPAAVRQRTKDIEAAIREQVRVRFRYTSPVTGTETVELSPVMIYHNTTDDLWYCVCFPDDEQVYTYRLDRIRFNITILHGHPADPVDPEDPRLKKLRFTWGAAFHNNEPVTHIKLFIRQQTANILSKIRADTAGRNGTWIKQDDGWIYEDDIIGLSSFRAWLMSFGSSVKVLEPVSLAEDLCRSSAERLRNYQAGTFV